MFVDVSKEELAREVEFEAMTIKNQDFAKEQDYLQTYANRMNLCTVWSLSKGDNVFGVIYNGKMSEASPFVPGTVITNLCKAWGYNASAVVGGQGRWCDVWVACDSVIRNAQDDQGKKDFHIYIEGFDRNENGSFNVVSGS